MVYDWEVKQTEGSQPFKSLQTFIGRIKDVTASFLSFCAYFQSNRSISFGYSMILMAACPHRSNASLNSDIPIGGFMGLHVDRPGGDKVHRIRHGIPVVPVVAFDRYPLVDRGVQ